MKKLTKISHYESGGVLGTDYEEKSRFGLKKEDLYSV